jgi:hypothetical protein
MCFILSQQVLHLEIQFPSRGMVQMSSARLHCQKGKDAVLVALRWGLRRPYFKDHWSDGVGGPE